MNWKDTIAAGAQKRAELFLDALALEVEMIPGAEPTDAFCIAGYRGAEAARRGAGGDVLLAWQNACCALACREVPGWRGMCDLLDQFRPPHLAMLRLSVDPQRFVASEMPQWAGDILGSAPQQHQPRWESPSVPSFSYGSRPVWTFRRFIETCLPNIDALSVLADLLSAGLVTQLDLDREFSPSGGFATERGQSLFNLIAVPTPSQQETAA